MRIYSIHIIGDESLLNGIVFVMCHTFNPATREQSCKTGQKFHRLPRPAEKKLAPPRPAPPASKIL